MPLKCLRGTDEIYAFDLGTDEAWDTRHRVWHDAICGSLASSLDAGAQLTSITSGALNYFLLLSFNGRKPS